MPYTVRKRDDEFCVVLKADPEGKTFGCHDTEEKAQAQIAAIEANEHKWVTVEEMEQLCPDCAKHMRKSNLAKIDLMAIQVKAGSIENLTKHLVDKYGGDPQFFTKCMDAEELADYPEENRGAICARAHYEATGMWPGEHRGEGRSVDMVGLGANVKSLGNGRVGGYAVVFSHDGDQRDLTNQWFAKDTDYGWTGKEKRLSLYDHGLDPKVQAKALADGWELKQADDIGLWIETQLNLADQYEKAIARLVEMGKLGLSSGTASHVMQVADNGKITRWPIVEVSFTPMPAEPRTRPVMPLKSVSPTALDALLTGVGEGVTMQGSPADPNASTPTGVVSTEQQTKKSGGIPMSENKQETPQAPAPAVQRPPYEGFQPQQPVDNKEMAIKAAYALRFGKDMSDAESHVMQEVYGADYRQLVMDQESNFRRFLRIGVVDNEKTARRQIWSIKHVQDMLAAGLGVAEIKATMVEGQDSLGGYAVPPQRMDQVIQRIAGLTVVRGGGATVIQTASNMVEWVKLIPSTTAATAARYPTAMTGSWGDETTAASATNFTIGLEQIPVHIYSYPVDLSRSLLEDAANLEDIFFRVVADTLAIDEDDAFLIGLGQNRPRGIISNSTNTDSLGEVVSQAAAALTWAGLKALPRGINSQYRNRAKCSWIANSATGSAIEQLLDGVARDYINVLTPGEQVPVLGGTWRESEAMPDIAASAYPIIFGDLSGYFIVERLGMSVDRFHDSNTGAKKFRFEVYRRLGGRLIETWKVAVQKVSAS